MSSDAPFLRYFQKDAYIVAKPYVVILDVYNHANAKFIVIAIRY